MKTEVVMFAKAPVPGRVKTRLAASIGDVQAAAAHQAFIQDTVGTVSQLPCLGVVAHAGDATHTAFDCAREAGFEFEEQPSGDLGDRMFGLLKSRLRGARRVVFIGTDSPTLPAALIRRAFDQLEHVDIVIGPSFDGGYYLIGLKAPYQGPFVNIAWSTSSVFAQTIDRCVAARLTYAVLPFWYDVDELSDLELLNAHLTSYLRRVSPDACANTMAWLAGLKDASGAALFQGHP